MSLVQMAKAFEIIAFLLLVGCSIWMVVEIVGET